MRRSSALHLRCMPEPERAKDARGPRRACCGRAGAPARSDQDPGGCPSTDLWWGASHPFPPRISEYRIPNAVSRFPAAAPPRPTGRRPLRPCCYCAGLCPETISVTIPIVRAAPGCAPHRGGRPASAGARPAAMSAGRLARRRRREQAPAAPAAPAWQDTGSLRSGRTRRRRRSAGRC